jgi:hypothetical protein
MELNNNTQFTNEQLEHITRQRSTSFIDWIKAQPLGDNSFNQKTIASMEIALAALAAVPVGYINRHTGVFHKPEWMMGDDLDAALYFPVFGAHPLLRGAAWHKNPNG